jgi:peptide chain release factor 2
MSQTVQDLIGDLSRTLDDLAPRLSALEGPLKIGEGRARLAELDEEVQQPEFWNDQARASRLQKERTRLSSLVSDYDAASSSISDCRELLEMAEGDESAVKEIQGEVEALSKKVEAMEFARMLGDPLDPNNAILSVNQGQGGVDAADFAEMLLRMYTRYGEARGWTVELMDHQRAEEAGIKSATILIKGEYAYGYLKAEVGVHRLVRISPFDANARRQTSFAAVWVIPEIDDDIEIDLKPDDLEWETMRAGGAGGQHVNKTESAVRVKHVPSGIVVNCREERSQAKNRSTALKIMRAKLFELEMKKRLAEKDAAEAQKMEAGFGSQIRNYVLAPYRLAKDLRSGHETGNVDAVLDGDIQPFIESVLLQRDKPTAEA